ncbi:hypothetical protein AZI87_17065 [Bdellovibrio bacteriovorus]|uniref:Recombinase domain-containing protein n=2 Tax=Bdellovibrio bacteriovorus TaxID=959 RepID=A0A162G0P4_BDEBC|nr:hypothetical protein AZI87_17065 [Bdellovibrio bacteriovorus]
MQSHRSESFLRQKYLNERLSPAEIGAQCFSSKRTILAWLEHYKIPVRPEDMPERRGLRFGERREKGRIIRDEREQRVIAKMHKLRSRGYSYPQIVEVLNSMGVRPKSGKKWYLKIVFEVINSKISKLSKI